MRWSECIALLSDDSSATLDPDFPKDVGAAITAHSEPLGCLLGLILDSSATVAAERDALACGADDPYDHTRGCSQPPIRP